MASRVASAETLWTRLAWLLPVTMSAVVYFPITRNYFYGDDFFNFWYLANQGLVHFVLRLHGGHSCVTRNIVMALFHRIFGMNPAPFFWAVLLTHLLNVFLLYEAVAGSPIAVAPRASVPRSG